MGNLKSMKGRELNYGIYKNVYTLFSGGYTMKVLSVVYYFH